MNQSFMKQHAPALLLLTLLLACPPKALTLSTAPRSTQLLFDIDDNEHVLIKLSHSAASSPVDDGNIKNRDRENRRLLSKSKAVFEYEEKVERMHQAKRAKPDLPRLNVIFLDESVVVVNKASGVMCVPDINKNPSLLDLVWKQFGNTKIYSAPSMIVNRLDMDTSGLVVFGRTPDMTKVLNEAFRERTVVKEYEALLCGHVPFSSGLIDLPLQRDHEFPPFMRVATPESEASAAQLIQELQQAGYKKQGRKKAKASRTYFEVMEHSTLGSSTLPVTRIRLQPHTGRTHQLRVHCAAMGHPIVGDPTYGVTGYASKYGGLESVPVVSTAPVERTSLDIQEEIAKVHEPNVDQMCLHAAYLQLDHPVTGDRVEWRAPVPF